VFERLSGRTVRLRRKTTLLGARLAAPQLLGWIGQPISRLVMARRPAPAQNDAVFFVDN